MEKLLTEIERFIWSGEYKKTSILLSLLFSKPHLPSSSLEVLYNITKSLISSTRIKEAELLLSSLKSYSLSHSETTLLTDVKNLLSYCFRLKKQHKEAISEVKAAIEICKTKPELSNRLPILYLNLSSIYKEDLHDMPQAKHYASLAYEITASSLKHSLYDPVLSRHLAVSMLVLGQIEESMQNKEAAVIWYSKGIELDNIDISLLNQFKSRLYGVSFQKPKSRQLTSRQSLSISSRRNISSRVYSRRKYDSLNSSQSISTQYSGRPLHRKVSSP